MENVHNVGADQLGYRLERPTTSVQSNLHCLAPSWNFNRIVLWAKL